MKAKRRYQALIESIENTHGEAAVSGSQIVEESCSILSSFLYDYQVEACKATALRMLKTKEPLLIQMATGGGKSWVVVGLSYLIRRLTLNSGKDKKVMMVVPEPELVKQNAEKLSEVGFQPSIFCNKLGKKELDGDIIVGTPVSIRNALKEMDGIDFSAFFLDEAQHHTTVTKEIVKELKKRNSNLREVGLTATPHRTGTGYIYRKCNKLNRVMTDEEAKDPYYAEKVFEIKADELIARGKLVPPVFEKVGLSYSTEELVRDKTGGWSSESENSVFINGKNKLNETIVKDILRRTKDRKSVLIFAQNIKHAEMIKSCFGDKAGMTHSKMDDTTRSQNISDFKLGKLKYLINIESLTTGFDSPITDVVVFLRATESPGLFEQMLGRGLRINPDKRARKLDCMVLDYARNYQRHCPHGDPFNPLIRVGKSSEREITMIEVTCPTCLKTNEFMSGMSVKGGAINEYGYLCYEMTGELVLTRSTPPMMIAGHSGSRCLHYEFNSETGRNERCSHQWSRNYCSNCGYLNGNSEGYCIRCESPLSQSAYQISEIMLGKTEFGVMSEGDRFATVEDCKWVNRLDRHGNPILLVAITCKENPYMKVSYSEEKEKKVYEVFNPGTVRISVWLSPTSVYPDAREAWKKFCLFFFGQEINFDDLERLERVRELRYLSYGYQDNGKWFRVKEYFDGGGGL